MHRSPDRGVRLLLGWVSLGLSGACRMNFSAATLHYPVILDRWTRTVTREPQIPGRFASKLSERLHRRIIFECDSQRACTPGMHLES